MGPQVIDPLNFDIYETLNGRKIHNMAREGNNSQPARLTVTGDL